MKKLGLLFTFVLTISISNAQEINVAEKMLSAISNIHTLSMNITSTERLHDRTAVVSQKLEASFNPLKAKITFIKPNSGSIVMFHANQNDNEIQYMPNGFPYFNININPLGNLARRNNHHTILDVGFNYLADILEFELQKNPNLLTAKNGVYKNKNVFILEANHIDFDYVEYTMKPNENVRDVALKKRVSEYKIVQKNDILSFFDEHTNKSILIPSYYCKYIKLIIDPENMLPLSIQNYDKNGLLEQYDYENVIVNPTFKSDYFNID